MIKVDILVAKEHLYFRKKGSFTRGRIYLARRSKQGDKIVVRSNEGYWVPIVQFHWARSNYDRYAKNFEIKNTIYLYNRRHINDNVDVLEEEFKLDKGD